MLPIDPTSIPIIIRILDFFFDEGSKILEQRRNRKPNEQKTSSDKQIQTIESPKELLDDKSTITSKEDLFALKISDTQLKASQKSLEHLLELKQIYSERHELARKKLAVAGETEVSYKVLYEITESERELVKIMEEIKPVLESIFGKPIDNKELALYRKINSV